MILNVATFLVLIAALFYTWMAAKLTETNKKLLTKLQLIDSVIIGECSVIEKLDHELQLWKSRRKIIDRLEKNPSFRKKKIRGKRRKRG